MPHEQSNASEKGMFKEVEMRAVVIGIGLLLFLIVSGSANPAVAGYISMQTKIQGTLEGNKLHVSAEVTNRGDESAYNVQISAQVAGNSVTSAVTEVVGVEETISQSLTIDVAFAKPGHYPLLVTIHYTDANQYRFSALNLLSIVNQQATAANILGVLKGDQLGSKGSVALKVKNLDNHPKTVQLHFILPQELSTPDVEKTFTLGPHEEVDFSLEVNNFSALPGSSYPVYALLEYELDDRHFMTSASSTVEIITEDLLLTNRTLFIGAGIVLAIIFIYVNVRSKLRRRR